MEEGKHFTQLPHNSSSRKPQMACVLVLEIVSKYIFCSTHSHRGDLRGAEDAISGWQYFFKRQD